MAILNQGLEPFFHSLIPVRLQEKLHPNTAAYLHVRALAAMLVILTTLSLASNVIIGGYHLLFQPDLLKYDVASLAILLLLALQTGLFYRFNNYWISGLAFTNFYFLLAAIMLILTGGYHSVAKPFLLTCPIVSFLIGGRQEGIQNAIIVAVFCFAIAALDVLDFDLPDMFSGENPFLVFGVNWSVSLAVVATAFLIYETQLKKCFDGVAPAPVETHDGEMNKQIYGLMDRIVPASLRNTLDTSAMAYTRVQMLSALLVLGTITSCAAAAVLVSIHALFKPTQIQNDLVIITIALCFLAQLIFFYKGKYHEFSAMIMGYFYTIMIAVLVIAGGGYDSPFMILLMTCPMVVFMLRGSRGGLLNTALIIVTGLTLAYLEFIGFEIKNWFSSNQEGEDKELIIIFVIAWGISAAAVAACMIIYDVELEKPVDIIKKNTQGAI